MNGTKSISRNMVLGTKRLGAFYYTVYFKLKTRPRSAYKFKNKNVIRSI